MSKGSPKVTVRLDREVLQQINRIVEETAGSRVGEPWSTSAIIQAAVKEWLAHRERSRKWRRPRKAETHQKGGE